MKNENRCPVHPEYNPFSRDYGNRERYDSSCLVCCGLHHASLHVSNYPGEFVERGDGVKNGLYRIGPLPLYKLGLLRSDFGHSFQMYDTPSFSVDLQRREVYFSEELSEVFLKDIIKNGYLPIHKREWPHKPTVTFAHLLYSLREALRIFRIRIAQPPKKPFIEVEVR